MRTAPPAATIGDIDERDVQTVMDALFDIRKNTEVILDLLREDDDEEETEEDA